jgi:hypothetical protein
VKALRATSTNGDVADESSLRRLNAGLAELAAIRGMYLMCAEGGGVLIVRGTNGTEEQRLSFAWSGSRLYQHDRQGKLIGAEYR